MQRFRVRTIAAALAFVFAAAGQQPAVAQSESSGNQGQQQVKTDWSQQKLEQYVEAARAVREVARKYETKMKDTKNADKQKKLRKQYNKEATKAVEDTGLSVKEYNKLNQAYQADKKLRQRVQKILKEQRQSQTNSGQQ